MRVKTNEEIEKLKKSSRLADRCFKYICENIKVRNDRNSNC
jgi:Xaa-Pro aminopeptidase